MAVPELIQVGKELRISVPFDLKPTFRSIFKAAKWDSHKKKFIAENTIENLASWQEFLALFSGSVGEFMHLDEIKADRSSSESVARKAALILELTQMSIGECRLQNVKLRGDIATVIRQIEELTPVLEQEKKALTELEERASIAVGERDVVITPVLELYKAHDLIDILEDFSAGVRAGFRGKMLCLRSQAKISLLRNAMAMIGCHVVAIDELAEMSINRPLKLIQSIDATRDTFISGIKSLKDSLAEA